MNTQQEFLKLLEDLGGYYECFKDPQGKRHSPLVGYTARYAADGTTKQFVGDVYANFRKIERNGAALARVATALKETVQHHFLGSSTTVHGFCGVPEGSRALAAVMAAIPSTKGYIYPEKEVFELKTLTSRERSRLVFASQEPESGENWVLVEDVCNNFSTTGSLIEMILERGANVVAIACFLNRSMGVGQEFFYLDSHMLMPVISLIRKPIMEYRQDDPAVEADIAAGNVVWKPKDEWDRLRDITLEFSGF